MTGTLHETLDLDRAHRALVIARAAAELPLDQRGAYLDQECAGDRALRAGVEELLRREVRDAASPEAPAAAPARRDGEPAAEVLGRRVGHIRIVELLGHGGMGSVYVGFDEKLQRRVALKAVQEGRLDAASRARFLREARVLSQLHHPNICGIFDYLEADDRDFLVLELVDGRNLEELMAAAPASLQKMRIARQLAGVLAATHAKGIIHRDLKPANVMVTREGEVKVLDFGLAREAVTTDATSSVGDGAEEAPSPDRGTDYAVTRLGTVVGTLSYMSPEQARGEAVTAASDMYSYGLVLQELFTGRPVYESGLTLPQHLERARAGRTLPVAGLGSEMTTLVERLKSAAPAVRPSALDTLERLDWIAQRPRRIARRIATWAAVVVLAVVAGAMSWQANRIREEARVAQRERDTAQAVTDFLVQLFAASDPREARGADVKARDVLDRGARRIDEQLAGQPAVRATLFEALGNVYMNLGLFDQADTLFRRSLDEHARLGQATSTAAVAVRWRQAWNQIQLGRFPEGEAMLRAALADLERTGTAETTVAADVMQSLGAVLLYREKFAESEDLIRRGLALHERLGHNLDYERLRAQNNLALSRAAQGHWRPAAQSFEEAIAAAAKLYGNDHPSLVQLHANRAWTLTNLNDFAECERESRASLALAARVYGAQHPHTLRAQFFLGWALFNQGRFAESDQVLRANLEARLRHRAEAFGEIGQTLEGLANELWWAGRFPEAEEMYRRCLEALHKAWPDPDAGDTVNAERSFADFLIAIGRPDEALPFAQHAFAVAARGQEALATADAEVRMGEILATRPTHHAAARAHLERGLVGATGEEPGPRAVRWRAWVALGRLAEAEGDLAAARAAYASAIPFAADLAPGFPQRDRAQRALARLVGGPGSR